MNDLIERSAVIDLIDKYTQDMSTDYWTANYGIPSGVFEDEIMDLPSAQPEQRWIPCSERLPEESGYYIITAHDGVGHRTTFVKYQKKAKSWDLTGARSYWRVIAWMPLPEPYQGKERRTE